MNHLTQKCGGIDDFVLIYNEREECIFKYSNQDDESDGLSCVLHKLGVLPVIEDKCFLAQAGSYFGNNFVP